MTIVFLKKWFVFAAGTTTLVLTFMTGLLIHDFQARTSPSSRIAMTKSWSKNVPPIPSTNVFRQGHHVNLDHEIASIQLSGTIKVKNTSERDGAYTYLGLLDVSQTGRQQLVTVGDSVGPFLVSDIGSNYVQMTHEQQVWRLDMTGEIRNLKSRSPKQAVDNDPAQVRWEDRPALETTPFGKRVSENEWVIRRESIYEYIRELTENPVRAIRLYSSFSGVPSEDSNLLEGFKLQKKGERAFLSAMGLEDGMVIQGANMMAMDHQMRAESLVRQFMRGDIDAVVLDVKQNGENKHLIYIIR